MNFFSARVLKQHAASGLRSTTLLMLAVVLAACSGRADPPQPADSITQVPPPVVTTPSVTPVADQTVQVGQTATFTESASGTATLSYQWQRNGTAIDGATSASYTTPATVATDNGSMFIVVVTNSAGSATTAPAKLTVTVPVTLTITQSPADVTVASGASATFNAAATCSAGAIAWQWQRSSDGGTTFTNIASATAATYTLVTAASDNGAVFRTQASCSGVTQLSNTATLTVTTAAPPASGLNLSELTTSLQLGAELHDPAGIVFDAAGIGYFVDSASGQIRRLAADGSVATIAGGAVPFTSGTDGTGSAASFNRPRGIAIAADGTLYVTDSLNHTIRKITAAGVVTTLAGTVGASGSTDGTGAAARFNTPFGIGFGSDGNLYVADSENFTIRKVTPAGVVTTIAGLAGSAGTADGTGSVARFGLPCGVAGDSAGNLYVSDTENNLIKKVTLAGVTTTIAGNGSLNPGDAVGTLAGIPRPAGVALAGSSLYVAANGPSGTPYHGQIRRVDLTDLSLHTVTGQNSISPANFAEIDGLPATAEFVSGGYVSGIQDDVNRSGLAVAPNGDIYVTTLNNRIRVIDTAGVTTSLTGAAQNLNGSNGDGVALAGAEFRGTLSLGLASNGDILVADQSGGVIRRVTMTGAVSLVAGLYDDGLNLDVDAKGSAALFEIPTAVAGLPDGTMMVGEYHNSVIRKIAVDGTVTTFAGVSGVQGTTDGPVGTGLLSSITAMVRDPTSGALYVADYSGQVIRRVDTDGGITTIAGAPNSSSSEPDGTGSAALFETITGLALDSGGVIYAADMGGQAIRKITPAGVVTTLAGGQASDGSRALPNLNPDNLVVDANGTVYYVDADNGTVSSVSPAGVITLLVNGNPGLNGTVTGSMPSTSNPTGIVQLSAKSFAISSIKLYGPGGTNTVPYPSIFILTVP
jgi:sugar lactone lactonase YvrE